LDTAAGGKLQAVLLKLGIAVSPIGQSDERAGRVVGNNAPLVENDKRVLRSHLVDQMGCPQDREVVLASPLCRLGGVVPTGFGLDPAATYRGAFASSAPTLWTTGWTTLSMAGLLAN
jgi:hypothetical protein